jgi:hypothetical protein
MAGTDRVTGLIVEVDEALTTVDRRVAGVQLEIDIDLAVCAIASIAPTSGNIGDNITITGGNFEAAQGGGGVTINGVPAIVVSWAAGSIVVTVAAGTTTGSVVVTTNGGQVSNPVPYTVLPEIILLNPNSGLVGSVVVITGTDFGAVQGTGVVTFPGGGSATVTAWGDTQITCTVPIGSVTGNVTVTNGSGETTPGVAWTLVVAAAGGGLPSTAPGNVPVIGSSALLVYPPIRS